MCNFVLGTHIEKWHQSLPLKLQFTEAQGNKGYQSNCFANFLDSKIFLKPFGVPGSTIKMYCSAKLNIFSKLHFYLSFHLKNKTQTQLDISFHNETFENLRHKFPHYRHLIF